MKKVFLFLVLALIAAGGAFAQNYKDGATNFKFYTQASVNSGDGYRKLRLSASPVRAPEVVIGDVGYMELVSAHTAGPPNIIEILEVNPNIRAKWKVGDKTTVEGLMKDPANVLEYRISTPGNGYWVEFTGTGYQGLFDVVDYRKFGVILPNSAVRVFSMGNSVTIESGAIGWDDEFMYANNLDDFMKYLAQKVDYDKVKRFSNKAKFDGLKTDEDKRAYCAGLVAAVATGEGVWGAVWGAFPPWLIPLEFANVLAQFTAQAYMAAVIGYLHGYYPVGGDAFQQQLKLDNYVLYAGYKTGTMTADTLMGMGEGAAQEVIQEAAKLILTKIGASSTVLRSIPVVGTVWGVGKGAYDGFTDAIDMGTSAYTYYSKGQAEFSFDTPTKKITRYNGSSVNITIPATIDGKPVEVLAAGAFQNNKNIESITLGENIKTIEAGAFEGLTRLKTVTLRSSVRTLGASAFSGCGQLTTVNLPSNASNMKIGTDAFKGTRLDFATKVALRKIGYTGAGVGKGLFIENKTGATITVIERKNGSNWSSLSIKSVKNGTSSTRIDLEPGTYDIRTRTQANYPAGDIFEKKNVRVTDDTTVAFTASDRYKVTRADYQAFIQARCEFSNALNVWRAMNTHASADSLYKTWAESYPGTSDRRFPYPKPTNKTDKELIQSQCKFSNAQAVWDAVDKHSDPAALLGAWAGSYYKNAGSGGAPARSGGILGGIAEIVQRVQGIFGGSDDNAGTARVPGVPTGVAAARNPSGSTDVRMSWKAVSGATGYRVYYSSTGTDSGKLEGSPTATTFTSTGNYTDKTHYFRVSAVNSAGEGAPSSWVTVGPVAASTTPAPAPTPAPGGPTTWTAVSSSPFDTSDVNGVAFGNNTWVAVGRNGKIAYSADGRSWIAVPAGRSTGQTTFTTNRNFHDIAFGNGTFIAVGNGGMAASTDGRTWTAVANAPNATDGIAFGGGRFIAVGSTNRESLTAYSTDGRTWTAVDVAPIFGAGAGNQGPISPGYGNNRWVVVGHRGKIAYSSNGAAWTAVANSTFPTGASTGFLGGIAYGGNRFVAVGHGGKIAYSSDGAAWTAVANSGFVNFISAVAFGNNRFVAVGDSGQIAYSADGASWTAVANSPFGTTKDDDIFAVVYGNGRFVAVGEDGKMAYADW